MPYAFEDRGEGDWMARHFFFGGLMPSATLMPRAAEHLRHVETWTWDGTHYQRTAEAWLARLDRHREAVLDALRGGPVDAARVTARWRIFFMACAELFGFAGGREWQVVHHAFEPSGI